MEWCVTKTGFAMFDALHAYGLAILLATASHAPIELQEEGLVYCLSSSIRSIPSTIITLERLFPLPHARDLQASNEGLRQHSLPVAILDSPCCRASGHHRQSFRQYSLPVAILDGLLAVLFTVPGPRVVSVNDLLSKQRLEPSSIDKSLSKASKAIQRWKKALGQQERPTPGWIAEVLRGYERDHPSLPIPANMIKEKDITVPLTIDPAFGYSTRRQLSDGFVTQKTNLTLHGAEYAALLACIGAARFLRAHRLSEKLVNFYVPLATRLIIDQDSVLPILFPAAHTPTHAVVQQWLALPYQEHPPGTSWRGMAYQTLQTQGMQQSLSLDRGFLDCVWLMCIERDLGAGVVHFWRSQLDPRSKSTPDDREHLLDCLKDHRMDAWIAHLQDVARHIHMPSNQEVRPYSLNEARRITSMMNEAATSPLRQLMEREEGTLNFGHALWLLGRYNRGILRELIELLEATQTLDQLIRVSHRVVQECVLARAKWKYIIIPSRDDFTYLLDDAHQHGVHRIAGLLMILSALSNPHTKEFNKYEAYTLISVLLFLATHIPITDEPEATSPAEIAGVFPAEFVPESFEGEQ